MKTEFNFWQQWYPLSPVEDLNPQLPTTVTVLGIQLVIWKPQNADSYQVFLDRCPHRLAPLSEGKIDEATGNIMCSYHGWQFDSQGNCTRIPQADNQLVDNQQLCATVFPARQANDLLWVWMDAESPDIAAKTPLPLSPQIDAEKGFVWSSFVRDLAYDWQTLVENVADPSHVPFAHHGVQGKRENAKPLPLTITQSRADLIEATTGTPFKTTITFQPPCRLEYAISFGEEKQIGLITYSIPVAPGKSRIVAQFSRNFAQNLQRFTPRWWEHIKVRNRVLDGDMILLSLQEHLLQQRGSWQEAYKLPTSADRLVIEFRRWFDRYCQGNLPWQQLELETTFAPINIDRHKLLDRYSQHTQHCSSCRQAVKNIQRLKVILIVNFILTISSVAVMNNDLRSSFGLPLTIVALSGLGIWSWLRYWLQPKFYFVNYVHAER
ncbi:aromatic ring-hydroxylating dioxygenase subunit alpha [Pleurocapsa sp. FMAR1]|uniref:aromatic ring-hydroxylating dioxygenase subunit alpha n=1 Tax=Pleurocapsa sp. FMAR1 TaxID=3040204 RepID=UPI0029C6FB4F|nr:Rieske 2Fe-2S domain-containing protein [Pleurocapsa sp. FMAR1]